MPKEPRPYKVRRSSNPEKAWALDPFILDNMDAIMEIGDLDDDDPTTHQWVYIALAEKDQATYLVQKACPSKMDQWTNSPALEPGQLRMIAVFPDTDPHHEYVAIDRFRPLKG